ncbi:hypothetical protein AB0K00_25270 [Dactylosporangium sp. NPDC049525]|uniref:hypothetical protein n=1 Tax=Dactylosporangium sp. NPDC049525 TaxID=3154730 RepID=UPI00342FFC8B
MRTRGLMATMPSSGKTWAAFLTWLIGGIVLAAVAVLLYVGPQPDRWSTVAIGFIVTAATMLAGGVVGFIFGVPRVLAADSAGTPRRQATITGNTNLEQISDWLTKILVGVGLTQFGSIASGAGRLIGNVAPAFGDGPDASVFTGGLGVFSIGFGFVTGWLYTRLLLGGAMAQADRRATARDLIEAARNAEQAGDGVAARGLRVHAMDLLDGDGDDDPDGHAAQDGDPAPAPAVGTRD